MAALPYMCLYPTDYLLDTKHLSLEEHGAYLLLILHYWQTSKPLSADDKRLSSICLTSVEKWLEIKDVISEFFIEETDENTQKQVWRHRRIDLELQKVMNKSLKAQRAGKLSAAVRYGKTKEIERTFNHTDTDTDTDKRKEKVKKEKKSLQKEKVEFLLPDWVDQTSWDDFVENRKAMKSPLTLQGKKLLVTALTKLRESGHDANQALQTAVMNGWKSVYAPKKEQGQQGNKFHERLQRLQNKS